MMLECRQKNLVAPANVFTAVRLRHEVHTSSSFRVQTRSHLARRAEKQLCLAPGLLVGFRCPRGKRVRGTVNVRVVVLIETRHGVDDRLRFLGRGSIIKPDQRLAMYPAGSAPGSHDAHAEHQTTLLRETPHPSERAAGMK